MVPRKTIVECVACLIMRDLVTHPSVAERLVVVLGGASELKKLVTSPWGTGW